MTECVVVACLAWIWRFHAGSGRFPAFPTIFSKMAKMGTFPSVEGKIAVSHAKSEFERSAIFPDGILHHRGGGPKGAEPLCVECCAVAHTLHQKHHFCEGKSKRCVDATPCCARKADPQTQRTDSQRILHM